MATSSSISALIKNVHASIQQAYQVWFLNVILSQCHWSSKLQNYVLAEGNLDEQQRWANEFRWELARHSVAEELIVYPAFEKYLGAEGQKLAHADRAEQQEVSPLLFSLINFVVVLNSLKIS